MASLPNGAFTPTINPCANLWAKPSLDALQHLVKERELHQLLDLVRLGALPPERAVARLKHLPFEDLGFAKVDHHRALRQGYAEVIFGKGKTPAQVAEIVRAMLGAKSSRQNILARRLCPE